VRTSGVKGESETEQLTTSVSGQGQASTASIPGSMDTSFKHNGSGLCSLEGPKGSLPEDTVKKYMDECLASREKLRKAIDKLDHDAPALKPELCKMEEVEEKLGTLYDQLAEQAADIKVGKRPEQLEEVMQTVRRQAALAISLEAKNRKFKKVKKETAEGSPKPKPKAMKAK
ncbi:unnamed protein product, partial [Effrenium voratum]